MEGVERPEWSPARQCTATSKGTGQRCQRQPIPGGTVCAVHGGGSPQAQRKAAEVLAGIALPAASALFEFTEFWHDLLDAYRATKCPTCGLPTGDVTAVIQAASPMVKTAQVVLDRTGFGPKATLTLAPPEPIDRVETVLIDVPGTTLGSLPPSTTDATWTDWLRVDELRTLDALFKEAERRRASGEPKPGTVPQIEDGVLIPDDVQHNPEGISTLENGVDEKKP